MVYGKRGGGKIVCEEIQKINVGRLGLLTFEYIHS